MNEATTDRVPVIVIESRQEEAASDWATLLGAEFAVEVSRDPAEALARIEAQPPAIVLADATEHSGVLATVAQRWPNVLRMVMGHYTKSNATMKAVNEIGVFGMLPLPLTVTSATSLFQRAAGQWREQESQRAEIVALKEAVTAMQAASIDGQAHVDGETGLWDRPYLIERIEDEANRLARYGTAFGLLIVEVVDATPALGLASADLLRGFVRKVDVAARLDGEAFAVLCPNTDQAGMDRLPERVREAFRAGALPDAPEGVEPNLIVATVALTDGKVAADEVLARAHEAWVAAKKAANS